MTEVWNREAARAALAWLVEMGADEAAGEEPVDRFAATAAGLERRAPSRPARESPTRQASTTPALAGQRTGFEPRQAPPVPPPAFVPRPAASPPPGLDAAGGDAAAMAASCRSLEDIATALARFEACPLHRTAMNLCYAEGNPAARVMFIGEAPGRDEDIEGKPFVGRSGQLLDRMLAAIGLDRNSGDPATAAFITNVIFWRPPGNRKPTEAETLMCMPFVLRTIELQKPEFIVCLGATPAQRLLQLNEGILKLRGRWRNYRSGERAVPLLPTLHPAYLLRQPAQKRLAWRDLIELRKALGPRP